MERTRWVYRAICEAVALDKPVPVLGRLAEELRTERRFVGDSLAFLIAAGMVEVKHRRARIFAELKVAA